MNLRTRLLASFSIFVLTLLALGSWSIWNLQQLGLVSQRILSENSVSVTASDEMKYAAERIDSSLAILLLGRREHALPEIEKNRRYFDRAFIRAASNITEPGEPAKIDEIRRRRDNYYRLVNEFLVEIDAGREQQSFYLDTLEPAFHELHESCQELLQLNQDAMFRKSDLAASVARSGEILTMFIAGGLVLAGIGLAFFLAGQIVRPVLELKESAAKIAGGNLSARAVIHSRDEVGILAAEFNRMAERVEQLRRTDLGQMLIARQTLEVALRSLNDPVVIVNEIARVTRLNPAAEKIFGDENRSVGRTLSELSHDSRLAIAVDQALRSQQAVAIETVASAITLSANGTERAYRIETTPMRDDDGQVLGAIMLLDDVTNLRQIDKLKSRFIDIAASHLQAPLRDAELGIHALLSEMAGELNDNQRDLLENCRKDIEELEKVIRDLLTLSRIESGELTPQLAPTDLADFLNRTAEDLRPRVEAAEISFDANIDPRLPALAIDKNQISEVIDQLADNAIRCTPRGGEIQIMSMPREDYIEIIFRDNGCGIPQEYLPVIFNRFTRVPGTPSGGTGLGLAIAKRLIEAHGGQITVSSVIDNGTTFTIILPSAGLG
ncbi:MAG: HAMP domain-containing protein [Acidobacteria bacterium]|nr:HAMP domain-containing protein [Acidobacteriota bacterium]